MARQFNGSVSNYLSSALELNLPSDWTILFRVKNVVSTGAHQIFLGRRGGDTNGWAVGRQASGEFTFWGFGGATGSAGTVALGSSSFDAYALTRVSSGTGTFYKNSATALGTASITPGSSTGAGISLGNLNNAGTPSFPANCELAEVAIFSRVLNSTELGQWFSGDSPSLYDTGLIHYWKLDASSGGETATTGGYNLTQVGTVTATTHPTMNYGSTSTPTTITATLGNVVGSVASKSSPKTSISATLANISGAITSAVTGTLVTTISATIGNVLGAVTSTGSTTNGTFTSEVLKDYAGNVLASVSLNYVRFYNDTTGALVLNKTGVSTNASGIVTFTDAALVAGTTYRVDWETTAGSRRMPRKAAA